MCPAVRLGVGAVASQAAADPGLRARCLDLVECGFSPYQALQAVLAKDALADKRQIGLVDASGRATAHTGAACQGAYGHIIETDCVITGNTLVAQDVLLAVAASWCETDDCDLALAERMLYALEAGEAAGGDRRGCQSAALLVANENPLLQVDLRVDSHLGPLVELRSLLNLFRKKYETIYRALAFADAGRATVVTKTLPRR